MEALAWANEQGIVVGVGNSTLSPQSHATRAQVATHAHAHDTGHNKIKIDTAAAMGGIASQREAAAWKKILPCRPLFVYPFYESICLFFS